MKKLYYVVDVQLQDIDGIKETTGWKVITCYEIIDNQPKMFCDFEAKIETSTEEEIQTYLDNNEYDEEFEFIQL